MIIEDLPCSKHLVLYVDHLESSQHYEVVLLNTLILQLGKLEVSNSSFSCAKSCSHCMAELAFEPSQTTLPPKAKLLSTNLYYVLYY